MKNILIGVLFITVVALGYLQFKPKGTPSDSSSASINEQAGMKAYNGSKFSFNYPEEYTLAETVDGVTVTSVPIPKVDTAKCQQLEEEARASCLKPQSEFSPNISIKFIPGDANKQWEKDLFGDMVNDEYKKFINDQVEEVRFGNPPQTYKYYYTGGEYGGYGKYGLLLDKGLLLAIYSHKDMEGGYQFSSMKSSEYRLDRHEQKKLVEQILATLTVK